jgi:hypothetical protein
MSMKDFSQVWLYYVALPTSTLSLAWLVKFRLVRARQLNLKFWSLTVIRPLVIDENKVRYVGILLLSVSVIALFSDLAWKFHLTG